MIFDDFDSNAFFAIDDCKYIFKFNLLLPCFYTRLRVQHPIRDISTIINS